MALNWYLRALEQRPILVKALTSGALWGLGDSIAQRVEHSNRADGKDFKQEWARTARMSGFAFAVFAPLTHKWYGALEKRFPGTSTKAVLQRVALDQTGYAFFILSTLFTTMSLLEGKSAEQAAEKWRSAIGPTMKVNWAIWPAVQLVNMKFVPLAHRVLVVNVVNLPWTTYLAIQAAKAVPSSAGTSDSTAPNSGHSAKP